jgi:hypothetical protein
MALRQRRDRRHVRTDSTIHVSKLYRGFNPPETAAEIDSCSITGGASSGGAVGALPSATNSTVAPGRRTSASASARTPE